MRELIEIVVWFLMGLMSITIISLATWVALREVEIPRVGKWSLVLGALVGSTIFVESVAWLLIAMTMIATLSLPLRIALRDRPRWVKWAAAIGAVWLLAALLVISSRYLVRPVSWVIEQGSKNGSLLLMASLLLLLSLASAIWMLHPSTDRRIRTSYLRGVLIWTGVSLFPFWFFFGMATFERAIISAVDGEIQPDAVGIVQWKLRWNGDARSWLQDLPAASEARCPRNLFPNGACCLVDYPDGRQSEIHIFRTGFGRYTVRKLSFPSFGGLCRNPQFDPRADPESPTGREFVPCDQRRRS